MNFDVLTIKNTTIITRDDNYRPKKKKKKVQIKLFFQFSITIYFIFKTEHIDKKFHGSLVSP